MLYNNLVVEPFCKEMKYVIQINTFYTNFMYAIKSKHALSEVMKRCYSVVLSQLICNAKIVHIPDFVFKVCFRMSACFTEQ